MCYRFEKDNIAFIFSLISGQFPQNVENMSFARETSSQLAPKSSRCEIYLFKEFH